MKDIKQIIREELQKVVAEETTAIEKGEAGDCYKNVQDYLLDNDIPNAVIIHGVVTSRNGTLNHAWIETNTEVYDPTTGIKTDKETYYAKLNPKVNARYTFPEAMKKRFSQGNYGPWTEIVGEELEELLGQKPIHVYEEGENFFPLATNVSLVTEVGEGTAKAYRIYDDYIDTLFYGHAQFHFITESNRKHTVKFKSSKLIEYDEWTVTFKESSGGIAYNKPTEFTGGTNVYRIFATYLEIIEYFLALKDPDVLAFLNFGEQKYNIFMQYLKRNMPMDYEISDNDKYDFMLVRTDFEEKTDHQLENIIKDEINILNEKHPMDYNENLLIEEITRIAKEENLPTPTTQYDSGSDAMIFETSDPNMIIRAELIESDESPDDMRESILANPDIQETGGVTKVYNIDTYQIGDEQYLISWKEKVDPNFEYVLWRKYGDENTPHILYALHLYNLIYGVREQRQQQLDILKNTEETSKLYDAVMQGLPVTDLAPSSNMGVNNDGYIVAYDC